MQILHDAKLYSKTFGVFTFCDELGVKSARRLKQWVCNPEEGQGAVTLAPYGWVAITNAPPEDEHGNPVAYVSNFERLQAQALAEDGVFKDMGLSELIDDGFASHSALVSRLNRMFLDHLKATWAPQTLRKLDAERGKIEFEHAFLGMPPAHETDIVGAAVKGAIVEAINDGLHTGTPDVVREYVHSVLRTLKHDVIKLVHQTLTKSDTDQNISPILARQPEHEDIIVEGKHTNMHVVAV